MLAALLTNLESQQAPSGGRGGVKVIRFPQRELIPDVRKSARFVQDPAIVSGEVEIVPPISASAAIKQRLSSTKASIEIIDELPIILSLL